MFWPFFKSFHKIFEKSLWALAIFAENQILAKLKYGHNSYEVLSSGTYVICAVSGKKIPLNELKYWNVELQEAYFSPKEAHQRYEELNKKWEF